MANKITIIEDTREQTPLDFSGFRDVDSVRRGLKTGDYSIEGYENQICFERKSIPDLVGTLIKGHERFLREMERMQFYEIKYILVERTPDRLYWYCDQHGWEYKFNTIIQSLLAYACHYQVRVRFCKDRKEMADYIVRKSREFIKTKGEENGKNIQNSKTISNISPRNNN